MVTKKQLLYIAALFWTFAGGMLTIRGLIGILIDIDWLGLKLILSVGFGLLFYNLVFIKVSSKHIQRIIELKGSKHTFYSFFSKKSFILIPIMIAMGVGVRLSGYFPIQYLSIFYIVMGTPLLVSALRFYRAANNFKSVELN